MKQRPDTVMVYDFDGTLTDSTQEVSHAVRALLDFLQMRLGVFGPVLREWHLSYETIKSNNTDLGIRKHHEDPSIITAPLNASVYEYYVQRLIFLFVNLAQQDPDILRRLRRFCSEETGGQPVPEAFTHSNIRPFIESLLQRFFNNRPQEERRCFRPGAEDHLRWLQDRIASSSGQKHAAIISNSPQVILEEALLSRPEIAEIINSMCSRGDLTLAGGAKKDHVVPWDGKVDVRLPEDSWRRKPLDELPAKVRLTRVLGDRPVYVRRLRYYEVLSSCGFTGAPQRFAFGDCVENDLLIPHMFGAHVGFVLTSISPMHECDWVEDSSGAFVIRELGEIEHLIEVA